VLFASESQIASARIRESGSCSSALRNTIEFHDSPAASKQNHGQNRGEIVLIL
jgi:hypothetical protein